VVAVSYKPPYRRFSGDVNRAKLSDWLLRVAFETEDFPFGLKPVIERVAPSIAALGMKLIGPLSDADLEIVARRNRLAVDRFLFLDGVSALRPGWFFAARGFMIHPFLSLREISLPVSFTTLLLPSPIRGCDRPTARGLVP